MRDPARGGGRGRVLASLGLCLLSGLTKAHTFVYVANYNNSTIGVYAEHGHGRLTPQQTIRTPGGPESVVADKLGFVVTADSLAHAVSAYRVNPANGRLTRAAVRLEGPRSNPFSVTASPGGRFLYVANSGDSTVGIYHLHSGPGTLARAGRVHEQPGAKPYAVALTPNGRYVYVANYGNATIGMFQRKPGHAALASLGVFHEPPGDGPYGLSVGPDGRFLYVADFRANVLLVLAIGPHGRLTLKDRVIEPYDHHPDSLIIDPSGRYLFVANTSANDISVFHINQGSG
ncbi:MAG: lactonase family protein, partial [Acidiferrobacter sp.]